MSPDPSCLAWRVRERVPQGMTLEQSGAEVWMTACSPGNDIRIEWSRGLDDGQVVMKQLGQHGRLEPERVRDMQN